MRVSNTTQHTRELRFEHFVFWKSLVLNEFAGIPKCTSSGVSVSDHAKCALRAACMHTRIQRCFGSQPSIMRSSLCARIHPALEPLCSDSSCSVPPSCVSWLCLLDRERFSGNSLKFHSLFVFAGKFWVLEPKTIFFHQKSHTLRFSIFKVGWLVGCDLVPLVRRVPGLPIRDCARSCNNRGHTHPQLSATVVTEKTFFERLYLVVGLRKIAPWVNCPYAPTTPTIHCTTISRFLCNFFPRMDPQFFWSTIHQVIWPSPGTILVSAFRDVCQ